METPAKMTKKDARIIKRFRKNGTWRVVAKLAAEEWPERGYCNGNQIEGRMLCQEAALTLGEDPWKPPWN